ncbi:steroidogenic acute regulatory protein, mitochondrial-like [Ostrea edulis]|uniref:steroidogenic acute regulatory protein, mitochondrial-like n=1 Tax=Ostrea edulis TaxID=37623 RepID=UPI0024AEED11|nr:steroidogenic acute regulatory protein, mitochondrial-like [Ostrea edulis]
MAGTKATVGLLELERDNNGWALEDDDSSMNITIHSKYMDKWGLKIYRIEADVNVSARVLWEDMVMNVEDTASWNKDMKKVKQLEQVNSCTDIIRQTMHEIAGLMSSRSLLLVRQWSSSSGMFIIATSSMTAPRYPNPDNIVM